MEEILFSCQHDEATAGFTLHVLMPNFNLMPISGGFFHCPLTYTFKSDPYLISAFCTGKNLHLTLETAGMCRRDLAANPGQKIRWS